MVSDVSSLADKEKLLAIDPSLTASGWALFSLGNDGSPSAQSAAATHRLPLAVGVICPPGPEVEMSRRLASLQTQVEQLISKLHMSKGDFLVCEGPAPIVLNPDSAIKVERVRGIFETVARSFGLVVPGRINPRTVQSELLGMRGKQLSRSAVKEWARHTAQVLFGPQLASCPINGLRQGKRRSGTPAMPQDIIDALLIGVLGASKLNIARRSGIAPEAVFEARGKKARHPGSSLKNGAWTEKELQKLTGQR